MKNILLGFLCLFCAFTANAQKVQLQDTSYTEVVQGKFFLVKLVTYTDGSYAKSATPQTDTTSVLNDYVAKIESRANQIADAAVIAMQARQAAIEFSRMDTICIAITGKSPMTLIMDTYSAEFSTGQWQIVVSGTPRNVTFPIHSVSKRRRILVEGDAVAKTLRMGGNMLWITNYPVSGTLNILYKAKDKENLWQSIDKSITLKRT